MDKLKSAIISEAIVIVALVVVILFLTVPAIWPFSNSQQAYCKKHYSNAGVCLLSSRVYTGVLSPNSFLILNFKPIKEDLRNYINENNFSMSIYIENLRSGAEASFGLNSNKSYAAASLNKLPVAVIILKKVERGKLSLDTKVPILDYERDASSGTLYAKPINELSVRELLRYMLSESDNTATRALEKEITKDDLVYLTDYVGYYSNDISSEEVPLQITEINPKSVSNIFRSLYLSTALKAEHSELILTYLTNTSFDINKYAQLPSDIVVSQKDGFLYLEDEGVFHSCGILYVEETRFFYCVMTEDIDIEKAPEVIGAVVNKLYNFIIEQRKIKDIKI